jgi:hypothetical protein
MARIRDINDIDEDEDGQIVDYSGNSDDGNKLEEDLPEEILRRRPAPDLGALDTSQPQQYSTLRVGDELLVRSNQAFRGEKMPRDLDLPKPSTHLMLLEELPESLRWLRECNGISGREVSGTYWISWPVSV